MKTRRISRIHEDSREVAKRDTNSSRFSGWCGLSWALTSMSNSWRIFSHAVHIKNLQNNRTTPVAGTELWPQNQWLLSRSLRVFIDESKKLLGRAGFYFTCTASMYCTVPVLYCTVCLPRDSKHLKMFAPSFIFWGLRCAFGITPFPPFVNLSRVKTSWPGFWGFLVAHFFLQMLAISLESWNITWLHSVLHLQSCHTFARAQRSKN